MGDQLINSDDMIQNWLNAFEYHRDPDKRSALSALHDQVPIESTRALVVSMMFDKAKAIFEVSRIIRGLEKRGGVSMTVSYKKTSAE